MPLINITSGMKLAGLSVEYADKELENINGAAEIQAYCLDEFKRHGYTIHRKDGDSRISHLSSTRFDKLFLGSKFDEYPPESKAQLLEHELVHMRQQIAGGRLWEVRYLRPRNCLVWEWQGYAQGMRSLVRQGISPASIQARIQSVPDSLWASYIPLRVYGKEQLWKATVDVLSVASGVV
jgi:hypothetical protein